ncbi:unnamed protein product [Orchesella dallaii]|uniref:Uncharacterized protein n=1 Tax=Orchesella dallaii TaxID=48710 RepID=A0ABP1S9X3_9HEXA
MFAALQWMILAFLTKSCTCMVDTPNMVLTHGAWTTSERDYCYCESCGHANREAIEKHHRFRMADLHWVNIQNKVIADDLKKTNEAQSEKIKKLEELLAQKEEVHFREVYKADKDSESNCVDVKSSQEAASDTRSDTMEGEVPQQILDEILDLENSASEKEEVVMDVDLLLKDD